MFRQNKIESIAAKKEGAYRNVVDIYLKLQMKIMKEKVSGESPV